MVKNAISFNRPMLTRFASLTCITLAAGCSDSGGEPEGSQDEVTADAGNTDDAGGGEPVSADWPMLGYDAESTYFNKGETQISVETVGDLEVAWTADLGGNINAAPIQVGDTLYVTVLEPSMNYAFDLETGDIKWQQAEFAASASFAYADGMLYALDFLNGKLHALDAETGKQQWETAVTTQSGMSGFSSPMIGGDLVIVGGSTFQEIVPGATPTFRGFVFAANKDTGAEAWNTYMVGENETGAGLWSSVSFDVANNRVYAGTGNNYVEPATDTSDALIALDMEDGAIEWKNQRYEGDIFSLAAQAMGIRNPDYDFGSNPIVFSAQIDGEVTRLIAGGQKSGDVHVLRADDGQEVWTRNISPGSSNGAAGIFNNGAWDGTNLLYAGNDAGASVLFALDPASGDIVWERDLPGPVMAPITVANGVGFVGAGPTLEAFDTATGELLFEHTADATIASAPTVANGRVAFGSGIQWSVGTTGKILTVLELP